MAVILLTITRSSVCAGDDCHEPHTRKIEVSDAHSLNAVLRGILVSGYLPPIGGGRATWAVKIDKFVAVVAQQWADPRYLVDATAPLSSFLNSDQNIHFRYEVQMDPDLIFEELVERIRENELRLLKRSGTAKQTTPTAPHIEKLSNRARVKR